jgi:hypothetical protein
MNSKNTILLLTVAALLLGFIVAYDKFVAGPARAPQFVLPGFNPDSVTAVLVRNAGKPELLAERTNGTWKLIKPVPYPGRAEYIQALLAALARLQPDRFLSASDLKDQPDAEAAFGFENPQATIIFSSGKGRRQVLVGARTAPGDQVFVEVAGSPGVHLVSSDFLKIIPQDAAAWRDPALLDWGKVEFDRVLVSNGPHTMELQRNPTNHSWRLVRLQARADNSRVNGLLKNLQELEATDFVTDDPRADLDAYGLQTPALDLTFALGTNVIAELQFGKSPTNDAKLVYARRAGSDTVVTVPAGELTPWQAQVADFRDRHLVSCQSLPASIEVQGKDRFTLTHETNNLWRVLPQNFIADTNAMAVALRTFTQMEVAQFVKDVVIESALTNYGLDQPEREYVLHPAVGATNDAVVDLRFGAEHEDTVYARRGDEDSVYAVKRQDYERLPGASWELRDRRIWHFSENDVARVDIEANDQVLELVRNGTNSWSVAPGFVGVIKNVFGLEETVHQAADLSAAYWTARGPFDRAAYGFTNPVHRLTFELKDGTIHTVEFGGVAPSQFPYATVTLDDEPWLFEFPWTTYQLIENYLSIPVREP